MATIVIDRKGYGQVEPNHLTGIVDGSIYAQLPVDKEVMGTVIENGRFAKYDMTNGCVTTEGINPWLMIYNEQKLYDERKQHLKDFAMVAKNYTNEEIVPRLIEIPVGDIFTTNTFAAYDADEDGAKAELTLTVDEKGVCKDILIVGDDGYLTIETTTEEGSTYTGPKFAVAKVYTMPDGQQGVKLQRIA